MRVSLRLGLKPAFKFSKCLEWVFPSTSAAGITLGRIAASLKGLFKLVALVLWKENNWTGQDWSLQQNFFAGSAQQRYLFKLCD